MDSRLRESQSDVLRAFSKETCGFALAGGTALELYYLHHRFSADLDFFSPKYDLSRIHRLVSLFEKHTHRKIKLESEQTAGAMAKVRFYTMPVRGSNRPLKIDFVEDVLFKKPVIRRIQGVRVYSAENIYMQKITAISGTQPILDNVGRQVLEGRREARDVFDLYTLSRKVRPLHRFLPEAPVLWQKGLVHWYRTFSRQELKLALLDLELYDKQFNSGEMIRYLENEIRQFSKGVIEAS